MLPFLLLLAMGRLHTKIQCESPVSIVNDESNDRTISITATTHGLFNDACWEELFLRYKQVIKQHENSKTMKLTISNTIFGSLPAYLCHNLPRLETLSVKYAGRSVASRVFDESCNSLIKISILCPGMGCSLALERNSLYNVPLLYSFHVQAKNSPSTVAIATQAIHNCPFLDVVHVQAQQVFMEHWAVSFQGEHIQLNIKADVVDLHHTFIRDEGKQNRLWFGPMNKDDILIQDISFVSQMSAATTLLVQNTGRALHLLYSGSVICHITVYNQQLPDTIAMALSIQDALLLLRAIESGLLDFSGPQNRITREQVYIAHRIVPFWIANGKRILATQVDASYAVRVLLFVRRFFNVLMA